MSSPAQLELWRPAARAACRRRQWLVQVHLARGCAKVVTGAVQQCSAVLTMKQQMHSSCLRSPGHAEGGLDCKCAAGLNS